MWLTVHASKPNMWQISINFEDCKNIVLLLGQTVKSADIVINHRMSLFYIEEDIYDKQPQWCMS